MSANVWKYFLFIQLEGTTRKTKFPIIIWDSVVLLEEEEIIRFYIYVLHMCSCFAGRGPENGTRGTLWVRTKHIWSDKRKSKLMADWTQLTADWTQLPTDWTNSKQIETNVAN